MEFSKFHYTIYLATWLVSWFATWPVTCFGCGRRLGFRHVTDRFKLSRHVEIARTWSQTGSGHIPLRYLARELVADLLASWSQAGQRNGIWSRTGLRPASELDIVMEFGVRHAHDVHTQVFVQLLVSRELAREPARELVADLLASWSQAG